MVYNLTKIPYEIIKYIFYPFRIKYIAKSSSSKKSSNISSVKDPDIPTVKEPPKEGIISSPKDNTIKTPMAKLADQFCDIYIHEWKEAFNVLRTKLEKKDAIKRLTDIAEVNMTA